MRPWSLLMMGRLVRAGGRASCEACLECTDPLLLACRLFFLLRTGLGTAAVAPPGMLLSVRLPLLPFAQLPLPQREAILQRWSRQPHPHHKKGAPQPPTAAHA